jgi:hypothetical protein
MGKARVLGIAGAREWVGPDGGHWLITTTWAEVAGRAEVVGLEITSVANVDGEWRTPREDESPRPVRTSILRAIPATLFHQQRAGWVEALSTDGAFDGLDTVALGAFDQDGRGRRFVDKNGNAVSPADALVEVARIYRSAAANPTKTVADTLHLSRSAAAKRVARARAAGLIAPTTDKDD